MGRARAYVGEAVPELEARGEDTSRRSRSRRKGPRTTRRGGGRRRGGGVHEVGEQEDDDVLGEHAGLWAAA